MAPRVSWIFVIAAIFLFGVMSIFAQSDPNRSILPKPDDPDAQPKNVKEMLFKMKVEQEKKEYDEMIERGDEAVRISEQLEKSFAANNQLSQQDREKLGELEKLVKKVRGELGGDGDDENNADASDEAKAERPSSLKDGVKSLQSLTVKMVEELKKTTRFSISAAAIQSSNAVLKVVRFLRGGD